MHKRHRHQTMLLRKSTMGMSSRITVRFPSHLLPSIILLSFFSLTAVFLLYKVDDFASRTKTLAGDNLEPTPWHLFPPKAFKEQLSMSRAYKILQCSYLSCSSSPQRKRLHFESSLRGQTCPEFFRWIHHDLEPWTKTRISLAHISEAKKFAAFRVVIVAGRLYVDLYYDCVQSRAMFTIWGLLQLLRRYPGMVPDVDMMFDCMDKPIVDKNEHGALPLPLFRYCTTANQAHFDIPFPDWSFWGWPETNLRPWNEEFPDIKRGSQAKSWSQKVPHAYWKGNPDVASPLRMELLNCNDSMRWGAEILRQNWDEEAKDGFEKSKLANQCYHRYKIYSEGYAWSVSLKYILSCNSLALIISPQYEDFFSRGLIPRKNYWPVSATEVCPSIKFAVDWGKSNPSEAEAMGQRGQDLMEILSMDRVYDYMFHLMTEYSKLLDFQPTPPSSALEVCIDSLLCLADSKQKTFLERSNSSPSPTPPCKLPPANSSDLIRAWMQEKERVINDIRNMERHKRA